MALAMSTMDSESLYRGNENIERTAVAYVLLKINKLGLRSGNATMNELSKYYALLFGKRPHEFIIGFQSIHHQEQQEEGQPTIFDGMFDYFSGSPVTVCHLKKKEFYYSWRKPTLGLRVAHRIQDEKSKHYYVYKVKGQQDSAYAVLRTLLNPLFLSDRWTGVLLDEVPRNLQGKMKDMYQNALLHASTCKPYLKATFRWLQPAVVKSAVKVMTAYQTSTVANEFVSVRKEMMVFLTKLQEHNRLAEERILACSVMRSRLLEGHPLHQVIANEYSEEKIAVTCDQKEQLVSMLKVGLDDGQNYSVYLGIAEGRLKVRQWISSKVPSVKGSDSDIYERVHPSETYYWKSYLSSGMPEKNSKVSDEALDYAIFRPYGAENTAVATTASAPGSADIYRCSRRLQGIPPQYGPLASSVRTMFATSATQTEHDPLASVPCVINTPRTPNPFHGDASENVEDWLDHFDRVAAIND
ncbi:hypothetical protein HPB51_003301 [Rhipicephalus microplus]|uniref:Uncharacterized protein n=1 Tax=Rhipicephalus microplus TaxID=6941 RepID=A0A9J6EX04_RHIMP|nr:hypothetical protein HPB51_003301 [Rhipicephalus microplus]